MCRQNWCRRVKIQVRIRYRPTVDEKIDRKIDRWGYIECLINYMIFKSYFVQGSSMSPKLFARHREVTWRSFACNHGMVTQDSAGLTRFPLVLTWEPVVMTLDLVIMNSGRIWRIFFMWIPMSMSEWRAGFLMQGIGRGIEKVVVIGYWISGDSDWLMVIRTQS